jgi:23S rRNA pseudouridine1911/1915/1917 synthase
MNSNLDEQPLEEIVTLVVPPGKHTETRLDVYLANFLQNVSRSKAHSGIKDGRVRINGKVQSRPSYTVQPRDEIVCRLPKPPPIEAKPEAIDLDIVYEDDVLIVLDKQAGLVVHPAYGNRTGTLVNALLHHVGAKTVSYEEADSEASIKGLSTVNAAPRFEGDPAIRPGLVHRLDKDTSGLMVIAKNDSAHAFLAEQFASRTIYRRYQAIVWGIPDPPEGKVDARIGRDKRDRKKMAVVDAPAGKHAVTQYRVLEELSFHAMLEFRLETGRTHQIRVHARHLGHPILGDPTYGGREIVKGVPTSTVRQVYADIFGVLGRQALHAGALGFIHPESRENMLFTSNLPHDMVEAWDRLRKLEGLA